MLRRLNQRVAELLPFLQLRKAAAIFAFLVVVAFLVELEESVEHHDGARCAHDIGLAIAALHGDVDRGAFDIGARHLAGDGALPDEFVKPGFLGG